MDGGAGRPPGWREDPDMDAQMRMQREREFEMVLIEVLTQDWDLPVRRAGERVERRRRGGATLAFDYHYSSPAQAKVVVGIEGLQSFSNVLFVDFSSSETIARSAEQCEALALVLMEHLQAVQEALLDQYASGALPYGRREDDYS
jgi:hypothetical protein